ncbi:meiosis-specific transcription factor ndt80 [Linnemannia zychae]|nr:meiosis-specific transcription factor ndt80 [Linnemannia zychae]
MNQTESYKVKVMARIEKGFFMARGIWTCYRRNYFQVSTAFAILGFDHSRFSEAPCFIELPDPLPPDFDNEIRQEQDFAMSQAANEQQSANFVMDHSMCTVGLNKTGYGNMGAVPSIDQHTSMAATSGPNRLAMVTHFSISISSKIANTSTQIGLIQHTPKRDKGPQNVPSRREIRGGGNFSLPITNNTQTISTFERVQFKTATANNGKRRAAQQFYILIVDLFAHTQDGHIIRVAASQSDSLVVRGRSPGHYIDNPEGDMMLSPTLDSYRERRHSSMSSQSSFHPYHNTSQYFGGHNGSQGISAGAGISVEMSTLSLGLSTTADGSRSGGPLSPIFNSPDGHGMGLGGDYSPSIAATSSFYPNFTSTHQGWTDASSMSSPASTYEGSTFSSPTMAYPAFQQYQNDQQPSPQENGYQHPNQSSYFAQRPSNYGSIPSMMMVGTPGAGISPGHSFDGRLETTVENSYESDGYGQSQMGYQQQQHPFNTPAAIASEQALYTSRPSDFPGFGGYPHQQPSSVSVMPMIKSEFDDSLKYTSTASPPILMQQRPAINNHFTHSDMKDAATPGSTTATTSSVSSSFGYTLQDMESSTTTDGNIANPHQLHHHQHQHHSYLPSVPLNDSVGVGMRTKDLNSAAPGYVPPRNVNIKLEQE